MSDAGHSPSQERLLALRDLGKTALSATALSAVAGASVVAVLYAGSASFDELVSSWRAVASRPGFGQDAVVQFLSVPSSEEDGAQGQVMGLFARYLIAAPIVAAVAVLLYGLLTTRFLVRFGRAPRRSRPSFLSQVLSFLLAAGAGLLAMITAGLYLGGWFRAPAERFLALPAVLGKIAVFGAIPTLLAVSVTVHFLSRWQFHARYRTSRPNADGELRDGG